MLYPVIEKSRAVKEVTRSGGALWLKSDHGTHRILPVSEKILRLTYIPDGVELKPDDTATLTEKPAFEDWDYSESDSCVTLKTSRVSVLVDKKTGAHSFYDANGGLLMRENPDEGRETEKFMTYKLAPQGAVTEKVKTADGEKTVIREAAKIEAGESLHTKLHILWQEGEELYGLGQQEEGFGSLRGQTVYLNQGNRKIVIPLLVSNLGYGLLVNCESPMVFNDNAYGQFIYCEAAPALDYFFLAGGGMSGTVKLYRELTGKAAMLPKWAFGYVQSQERFETEEEILRTAEEYRSRGIGLDCLVLDWMSWEDGKWGQKTFDRSRFPDPGAMTEKLHRNGVHFMISVWPSMSQSAENRKEFEDAGLMIPESEFYDPYKKEGRELYWKQSSEGLFKYGVDAWWCDNCEPFAPEWEQLHRPLPGRLYEKYCEQAGLRLPLEKSNSYALYHAKGVYEGQRSENSEKRVVNLTRSGYSGHQRFGTILWSGDIEAKWETLRRQIGAALGFCASGHPYWTVDIGAFFVRRGAVWYWKGDFPEADRDEGYRELFTRWYQWAAFLPVFRGHGTDCRRELWHYGDGIFYNAMIKANRLRYSLMPYIYSAAGATWLCDGSMIRLLAFDWPKDKTACHITDQYMFGDSMMVCPVTEPMYFAPGSVPLDRPKTRKVYLPEGVWYRYGEKTAIQGGRYIDADAPIDGIPVYVKAGGIIPTAEPALSTSEQSDKIRLSVYSGADGEFMFYDDSGDGYGYERGEYTAVRIIWKDAEKKLTVPKEIENRVESIEII